MKKCELCKSAARMYCESDQASLCWDCDSRVHSANFLVAKHVRTLLCQACQSLTPWTGSGPKLGPTASVCNACANRRNRNVDGSNTDDDDDDDDDDEDSEDEDDEDDSENQVVPLSLPPSLATSSSSSEDSCSRRDGASSSSIGYSRDTTNSRFSYNEIERPKEKKSAQEGRSWKWRW